MQRTYTYRFSIDVQLEDHWQLFEAAKARAQQEGSAEDVADLNDCDGGIDVQACLVMLLDPSLLPGCSIVGSTAELLDYEDSDDVG